jgi:O-antigen ligase
MLKRYLKVTLISAAIIGIAGTVMFCLGKWVVFIGVPRATGVLGWPNDYALFLNINAAMALALALLLKNKRDKILYLFIFLILVFSVIPTITKGAYLTLFLVLLLISMLVTLKTKSVYPVLVAFLTLAATSAYILTSYSDSIFYRLTHNHSFYLRIEIWESLLHKFFEHPIIGNGFMASLSMVGSLTPYNDLTSTHNLYLRILLETGILGLIAFLSAYFAMFGYALKIFLKSKQRYTQALAAGFAGSFTAVIINSFTENAFFTPMINLYVWFYFSFLVCAYNLGKNKAR